MSNTSDYASIMDTVLDDVQAPRNLPAGTWRMRCQSASIQMPKGDATHSPQALFVYTAQEPMDNVDGGALADLGPNFDYGQKRLFFRTWLETGNGEDMAKLKRHIEKHGIDIRGIKLSEALKQMRNTEVLGQLTESIGKDGEPRNEVVAVVPLN